MQHQKGCSWLDWAVDWVQQFVMSGLITAFVLMILKGWGCF